MRPCVDRSTTYLKQLGYNVVRHPQAALDPLDVLGKRRRSVQVLGRLDALVVPAAGATLPEVQRGLPTADIDGQASSALGLDLGLDLLGAILGAMGGQLGAGLDVSGAQRLQFVFRDVTADQVVPLEVGRYLRGAALDTSNPVVAAYRRGGGSLFLITKTLRSHRITVRFTREDGAEARLEVPVIEEVVGGNVAVRANGERASEVTFEGPQLLTFGFQCLEVDERDGALTLKAVQPGSAFLGEGGGTRAETALLTEDDQGLLDLDPA